jgi:hypothetical protein
MEIEGASMARQRPPQPKTARQIEAELSELFAQDLSDDELLARLEPLANEVSFGELLHVWGPELHHRNRVKFRTFLLPRIPVWTRVAWKKHAKVLDAWLEEVKQADDFELFHLLYAWKCSPGRWSQPDHRLWYRDLCAAFESAANSSQRARVLSCYDLQLPLDEATALALYQTDPGVARDFITRHVFPEWGRHRLWSKLLREVEAAGDEDFYFTLYRRLVSAKDWEKDVLKLCTEIADGGELVRALDQRHPEGRDVDLMSTFHHLLTQRGADVLPYVVRRLGERPWWHSSKSAGKLVALARTKRWLDLWSTLIRSCGSSDDFNKEIADILADNHLTAEEAAQLLRLLSGPTFEWSSGQRGFAVTHRLTDRNAVALSNRFPDLLHGPFRGHLLLQAWGETDYPKLFELLVKSGDIAFIDYLASQAVVLIPWYSAKLPAFVQTLTKHYEQTGKNPGQFAQRVVGVLGQLSAAAIGRQYRQLIKNNPLAKLLFEESGAALQQAPASVRDLLESPNGAVQGLALRLLAGGAVELAEMAGGSLDLLLPCLLRPLQRRSRRWAFQALLHAATTADNARLIVERARQAFDFQDPHFPREELLGVLAQLLHRFPELRRPNEQPRIHERTA